MIYKIFTHYNTYYGTIPALLYFIWLLYQKVEPKTYYTLYPTFIPYVGIFIILIIIIFFPKVKKGTFFDCISLVLPSFIADILFWLINWILWVKSDYFTLQGWDIFEMIMATTIFLFISILILSIIATILFLIIRSAKFFQKNPNIVS